MLSIRRASPDPADGEKRVVEHQCGKPDKKRQRYGQSAAISAHPLQHQHDGPHNPQFDQSSREGVGPEQRPHDGVCLVGASVERANRQHEIDEVEDDDGRQNGPKCDRVSADPQEGTLVSRRRSVASDGPAIEAAPALPEAQAIASSAVGFGSSLALFWFGLQAGSLIVEMTSANSIGRQALRPEPKNRRSCQKSLGRATDPDDPAADVGRLCGDPAVLEICPVNGASRLLADWR